MKITNIIFTSIFVANMSLAGPIKTQVTTNPESVSTLLQSGSYAGMLAFVRAAHAESMAENDDEITQYAYLMVLANAPAAMRIPLAVDFAMDVNDITLNAQGARAVRSSLVSDAPPTLSQAQKDVLLQKLKVKLTGLSSAGESAFDFARLAAEVLMLLNGDVGLDIYLTGTETVGNLKILDGWTPTSEASVFAQLKASYDQKANDPANENRGSDKVTVALYELCRIRRTENKEIKTLEPLANLDQLLPK